MLSLLLRTMRTAHVPMACAPALTTVPPLPPPPRPRYLTPFKAEWDPKDPTERLFVCGRCAAAWHSDAAGLAWHSPAVSLRLCHAVCKWPMVLMRCCRYISEDYGGVALHPIDIMDASSGRLLRSLTDGNLTTISPVNKPHPRRDIIVSGSSR